MSQSWDWLEDRRSKDNKVSKRMWKAVETEVEKTRVVEAEEEREKEERRKKTRKKRTEKRKEEEENQRKRE